MTEVIEPPIVVATGSDCAFYRDVADAVRAGFAEGARIFDALGRRLVVGGDGLAVNLRAADELAEVLNAWLHEMDALRESTANWSLQLLVRASVDHLGYS